MTAKDTDGLGLVFLLALLVSFSVDSSFFFPYIHIQGVFSLEVITGDQVDFRMSTGNL